MSGAVVAVAMVAVVVAMQWSVRAFASERGLYGDEAAHFMNGLVLRDYLWEGLGQWPVDFAVDYYRHYPKIAPFMWPPLFHALLGVFLLPGWPPLPAAIVFVGLSTAWIGWRLYLTVCAFAEAPVALGAVALLLSSPMIVTLSRSVMIDILVAACALEAAFWLGRFAHTGATRDGAVYGTMTALACMAKGNGLSVVLAPFGLLLITGQLSLLKRPGLYVAAAIVAGLAAPPLYLAWGLDATLGDFGPPGRMFLPGLPSTVALYGRNSAPCRCYSPASAPQQQSSSGPTGFRPARAITERHSWRWSSGASASTCSTRTSFPTGATSPWCWRRYWPSWPWAW